MSAQFLRVVATGIRHLKICGDADLGATHRISVAHCFARQVRSFASNMARPIANGSSDSGV